MPAELYYDLGSSYAYLAVARAERVLGEAPVLKPILLGAIFGMRGWPSWGEGDEREANIAECERRAIAYGLPEFTWPDGWPVNTLGAMRIATWATAQGKGDAFARTAFDRAFARKGDLSDSVVLHEVCRDAGLDPDEAAAATQDAAVKSALRDATDAAFARGVEGVPTIVVGDELFYGDDTLEQAAEAVRR